MRAKKPKAPPGTCWHRDILYGVKMIGGKRYRWSLQTSNAKIATARRKLDVQSNPKIAAARGWKNIPPFDKAELRRKLTQTLTTNELDYVLKAIDAFEAS